MREPRLVNNQTHEIEVVSGWIELGKRRGSVNHELRIALGEHLDAHAVLQIVNLQLTMAEQLDHRVARAEGVFFFSDVADRHALLDAQNSVAASSVLPDVVDIGTHVLDHRVVNGEIVDDGSDVTFQQRWSWCFDARPVHPVNDLEYPTGVRSRIVVGGEAHRRERVRCGAFVGVLVCFAWALRFECHAAGTCHPALGTGWREDRVSCFHFDFLLSHSLETATFTPRSAMYAWTSSEFLPTAPVLHSRMSLCRSFGLLKKTRAP